MNYAPYMTPDGDWAGNFYADTPIPQGMVKAPDGGRYGMRWAGKDWASDPDSEDRVDTFIRGPDAVLLAERAAMSCTRWQMIVAMGEANWAKITQYADSPDAPWAMRIIISNAVDVPRLSETVDALAWVLGMAPGEVDTLFRAATAMKA